MQLIAVSSLPNEDWRIEVNGEEFMDYQTNCSLCGLDEEKTNELYFLKLNEMTEIFCCDCCISALGFVLAETNWNARREIVHLSEGGEKDMKGNANFRFFDYATRLGVNKATEMIKRELPLIFERTIGSIIASKHDYLTRLELIEQTYQEYETLKKRSNEQWSTVYCSKLDNVYMKHSPIVHPTMR